MVADEVDDRQVRLAGVRGLQTAAQLLQKDDRGLRWPQHQNGLDRRHVDALVEDVDGEHHAQRPVPKPVLDSRRGAELPPL